MIGWNANLYDLNLFAQRLASLTEDQKKQLLHNADIKGRISHYLDLCDTYWECYWDAVSKAAQDILQEDQQASPQK